MAQYRKLIVAVLGAALVALDDVFGVSLAYNAEQIVDKLIPVLTAFGVWAAPNKP